jgi:3-oxoacyl-[acyl-carrier-protein] synthase III
MINLIEIKSYIPNNKLDNSLNYKKINKSFLLKKIGTTKVSRINKKKDDIISMCVKAFKKIDKKKLHSIKSIILCTQNPEYNGLPHNSALLQSELKKISNKITDDISCLDISHGCSGFVYSMKTIESFLKQGERGLIFTCDPYSKIIKPRDYNTELLFGDAAAVTLVQKKQTSISSYDFYTNGDYAKSLININGKLNMNGRNVLNFCMENVPNLLNKILSENKINKKDINYFFFHQGSKYIITSLRKKLNISADKMPMKIKNIGNTVSSSIPITIQKIGLNKVKRPIILCGFGVGLSVSICLLK